MGPVVPIKVVAALAVGAVLFVTVGVPAAGAEPTVEIRTEAGADGPRTMVHLEGWPAGLVTAAVCGNEGRRASQDCALSGSRTVEVPRDGIAGMLYTPTAPPIGCPCVLRVATGDQSVVRLLPIDLPGVPVLGPGERPADVGVLPRADDLDVVATIEDRTDAVGGTVVAALGGPADRVLVLLVTNRGQVPVTGLEVDAAVGRDAGVGEPLTVASIPTVFPGQVRRVEAPFELAVPSAGEHVVAGRVVGSGVSVRFSTTTTGRPWGLLVVALVLVAAVAGRTVWRRRGRRDRVDNAEPSPGEQFVTSR